MTESNGQAPEKPVILLVDDNTINLQVLQETLDGQGYQLLAARSGEEALRIAYKAKPDLILLVECRFSPSPVFLKFGKEEEFYIRVAPGSRRLSTSEVVAYVAKRSVEP